MCTRPIRAIRFPAFLLPLLLLCGTASAYEEQGLASWYGGKFQGRQTASGEIFDTNQPTAAHKTLPFGTIVRVTNLENGRSTVVRINDRGPFVPGRIIDLSRASALAIGLAGTGVARVRIEELRPDSPEAAGLRSAAPPASTYSIQVAAFRNRDYAERSVRRLREEGFAGSLEQTPEGIYRVVVKGVPESELAEARRRLREHGWPEAVARRQRP
jgi:rare lipoprotein A